MNNANVDSDSIPIYRKVKSQKQHKRNIEIHYYLYCIRYLFSYAFTLIILCFLFACNDKSETNSGKPENPYLEGFDYTKSDTVAIRIADEVMKASGGRRNWDKAKFFTWNFIGSHIFYWDKKSGNIRIESPNKDAIILMNLATRKGKVYISGKEVNDPDSIGKYFDTGIKIWENEMYWLFMPFKLKDPGVILKYLGEDVSQLGQPSDVIQLMFDSAKHYHSSHKYHIYIDRDNRFIVQWAIYESPDDKEPILITPWTDYEKYRNIWLSSGRGKEEITDIAAPDTLDPSVFTSLEKVKSDL